MSKIKQIWARIFPNKKLCPYCGEEEDNKDLCEHKIGDYENEMISFWMSCAAITLSIIGVIWLVLLFAL